MAGIVQARSVRRQALPVAARPVAHFARDPVSVVEITESRAVGATKKRICVKSTSQSLTKCHRSPIHVAYSSARSFPPLTGSSFMFDTLLAFAARGLTQASWGTWIVYVLVVTQLTILTVTLYLHRSQSHRGVDFHPALAHFFRFWAWFSTGMITKEYVAIHRKHHAKCETEEDPHSPQIYGLNKVLFDGVGLYREASMNQADMDKYGIGTPDDWIERNLYTPSYNVLGVSLFVVDRFPAVRRGRRRDLGDPDAVDPVLGRGRRQWRRPLVGLSQFRNGRHRDEPHAVGVLARRRRAAQQPPRIPELGALRAAQVRVRHRLGDDPPTGNARPRQGAAHRTGA